MTESTCRNCGRPIYVDGKVWIHLDGFDLCHITFAEPAVNLSLDTSEQLEVR